MIAKHQRVARRAVFRDAAARRPAHAGARRARPGRRAGRRLAVGDRVEAGTGDVIYEKAPDERRPMASTTKLMTALVTFENGDLERGGHAPRYRAAPGESVVGLIAGEKITDRRPHARAARGLRQRRSRRARRPGGRSLPSFVRQMNRRAQELGLSNTHYANPVGLDELGQLLQRPRPRDAHPDAARAALLPPHRRHERPDIALRRAREVALQPQHAALQLSVGRRGQNGLHIRGRQRPRLLGDQAGRPPHRRRDGRCLARRRATRSPSSSSTTALRNTDSSGRSSPASAWPPCRSAIARVPSCRSSQAAPSAK